MNNEELNHLQQYGKQYYRVFRQNPETGSQKFMSLSIGQSLYVIQALSEWIQFCMKHQPKLEWMEKTLYLHEFKKMQKQKQYYEAYSLPGLFKSAFSRIKSAFKRKDYEKIRFKPEKQDQNDEINKSKKF